MPLDKFESVKFTWSQKTKLDRKTDAYIPSHISGYQQWYSSMYKKYLKIKNIQSQLKS